MKFILICLAGALGTGIRYLTYLGCRGLFNTHFPIATFAVNIFGSILVGIVLAENYRQGVLPTSNQLIFTVGFLGAFTTYGTFCYESLYLYAHRGLMSAAIYCGASILFGLLAAGVGIWLGTMLTVAQTGR